MDRVNLIERVSSAIEATAQEMAAEIERLAGILDRLRIAYAEKDAEADRLREALESIAANTCCDKCQEAALVARAALAKEDK